MNDAKKTGMNRGRRILAASVLCILNCVVAHAMEIPLEGFGKSTKVAYVNMHKIFEAFPETERARVELSQLIDEKKAEITSKKEEIAQLKGEIQFLKKQMSAVAPSTGPKTTELPKEPANDAAPPETAPQSSTGLTVPEGSPLEFLFSPPAPSTAAASTEAGASAAQTPYATKISSNAPSILPGIPSPAPQLGEKEALLSRKEADLEAFVGVAEEEVKHLEEGKTMTLLARIYKSLEEVSAKEGYSIIVDKGNILYGENAIDITESVIWKLSAPLRGR